MSSPAVQNVPDLGSRKPPETNASLEFGAYS